MESKGLFELMFMLIMLVLLLPTTTQNTHIVTGDVQTQVNSLALLSDAAIADALSDKTFESCSQSNTQDYKDKVVLYLTNLQAEFNASGNNCEYDITSFYPTYSSGKFNGNIDVSCSLENSRTNTYIKKKLFFDKQISVNNSFTGYCSVMIEDNLTVGYNQVDYNLSYP